MLVYRVEHHETSAGPFQSEFYPDEDCDTMSPESWGDYLPCYGEDYGDTMYAFGSGNRRWGCHRKMDIEAIEEAEADMLSRNGWIVRVYEVPESCVFIAKSLKQVTFDFACAIIVMTLDLLEFIYGKEVAYAY